MVNAYTVLATVMLCVMGAACAHTNDDASIGRSATPDVSTIRDDADDATAAFAEGWTSGASADDHAAWMGERADVTFTVTRPGAFDALLDAAAFQKPRRVQIDVDGKPIAPPFSIPVEAGAAIVLPIGTLGFGAHQIRFESLDGGDVTASGRRLSVGVRRLTMERVGG